MTDIIHNVRFSKPLYHFMCYLNMLHIATTILIYCNTDIIHCTPSLLLTVTSYLFWSCPKYGIIMKIDEFMAHFNVLYHLYNSFNYTRELPVIIIVYCMIFFYAYSKYFLTVKNHEYSIFSHSIVVLLGNIAVIVVYH